MVIKNFNLNKNTKFVLLGLLLGSVIYAGTSLYTINNVQNKLDIIYSNYAQSITKSIAVQISNNNSSDYNKIIKSFLDSNQDISYIEYKDKNNNVLYSIKSKTPDKSDNTALSISSPVSSNDNKDNGVITIGFKGQNISQLANENKSSLTYIFFLIWITFVIVILINMFLMSKELKKLYNGVKQIATGKFGYKLESENMKELTDAFNDMSSILSKYEEQNIEQITLERNKLEAVLMSIINGVIVCDNFDNVVLVNSASLDMLDIEENAIIGTKIQNYIDSHGQQCFLQKIEEFKDTPLNIIKQKPIEFNIEVGRKTIKSMISPMFSKQQDYVGYIIVLINITRETEVNKLKNTFISNVSHELRTPVTVLRTYIDTLYNNSDDFDEETKKEFMKTLDTEARRLHSMVNDILDFSRLESGNIKLRKEYSNIVELIKQNINSIKILADEKNIKIDFIQENDIPQIPINIESIDRVIRNLLSNAIKYSNEGKNIVVSIRCSEDKQFINFDVKDNGIGIAKEHLEKIFERFYRVENATHTIKGTGLGLHLVKMTVEQHHKGKITVSSKEGEGSTFSIYLPVNAEDDELA